MPKAENKTGSQNRLPILVRRNNSMHQCEETDRLVVNLNINIKDNMAILLLRMGSISAQIETTEDQESRTFMRSSTVSAKVGMDCIGVFFVLACSIPSEPNHSFSRINPDAAFREHNPNKDTKAYLSCSSYGANLVTRKKRLTSTMIPLVEWGEGVLTRIVEHNNDVIPTDVDVCSSLGYGRKAHST